MKYLATFYTHFAALRSQKNLAAAGISGTLSPVPRCLSSSCGTCLRYESDGDKTDLLASDWEALYQEQNGIYKHLYSAE